MQEGFITYILEQGKRHGLAFCMLMFAVWFLNAKVNESDARVDEIGLKYDKAVDTQINYLKEDRIEMKEVIKNNTEVMKMVVKKLEK